MSDTPIQAEGTGMAAGLADPVLAYNLTAVADWSPQMPFLDLMKMSRPWIGHQHEQWGGQDWTRLEARGLLDAEGWPTEIPSDLDRIGTVFAWDDQPIAAESRTGVYVLRYQGNGTVVLGQDAHVLEEGPGRIVFENVEGGTFTLDITATDPEGTGDHLRDLSIVRKDHVAFHDAGALFNPDWLDLVADARQVRFMDWMRTNGSTEVEWEDRPLPSDVSWMPHGVPVEVMIQLANTIGADPWFSMPHSASDDYIAAFAGHVHDSLDPRLKAYVELSNEVWNRAFPQHDAFAQMARDEWGTEEATGQYVHRATETMRIWEDMFGDDTEARVVKVLAGQTVNSWLTDKLLSAEGWTKSEPGHAIPPADVFDVFTVATYFGGGVLRNPDQRSDLLAAIRDPDVDAGAWLAGRLMDPAHPASLFQDFQALAAQKALAAVHGLDLLAYEGGQHLHRHIPADGLTDTEIAALHAFSAGFVRSEHMATLYGEMWEFWTRIGDGPFMQYTDVGAVGPHGSWGAVSGLADTTPRADLLNRLNAESTRWWQDDRPETGFQHGVHKTGDAAANTLTGTSEEDYLAGAAGNDVLIAGPGNDGVHGGPGHDIARFSGLMSAYVLLPYPGGHMLTGPDGDDVLISVEEIVFADGTRAVLTDEGLEVLSEGAGQRRSALQGADSDQFSFRPAEPAPARTDDSESFRLLNITPREEVLARARETAEGNMFLDLGQGHAVVIESHSPVDPPEPQAEF